MDRAFKHKKLLFAVDICSVALVFALMLGLNSMLPYLSDDMHFKFIWVNFRVTEEDRLVRDLGDMLVSMKNYYNLSGGRVLLHLICYLFVYMPKWIFNIVNSAMFVLMGLMIRRLALINIDKSATPVWLLPLIYLICLIYIPYFGDVCVWLSGSVNYLWSEVLLLYCCYLIIKYIPEAKPAGLALCAVPIIISSLCNENTGAMLLMLSLFVLIPKRAGVKKYIYCFLCTVPWAMTVILARGNFARADMIGVEVYANKSIVGIMQLIGVYFTSLFQANPVVFILLLCAIYAAYIKRKNYSAIFWDNGLIYSGIAGVLALSLTGFHSPRPIMLGYIVYLAGFLKLVGEALYKKQIDLESLMADIKLSPYYRPLKYFSLAALAAVSLLVAFNLSSRFTKYVHDIKSLEYCYSRYGDQTLDKSELFPPGSFIEFLSEDDWFPPTAWNFTVTHDSPFIDWFRNYCIKSGKTGMEEFYIMPRSRNNLSR